MFFMLARNRTSNASPTTGMEPMVVSKKRVRQHPGDQPRLARRVVGLPRSR